MVISLCPFSLDFGFILRWMFLKHAVDFDLSKKTNFLKILALFFSGYGIFLF